MLDTGEVECARGKEKRKQSVELGNKVNRRGLGKGKDAGGTHGIPANNKKRIKVRRAIARQRRKDKAKQQKASQSQSEADGQSQKSQGKMDKSARTDQGPGWMMDGVWSAEGV